MSDKKNTCAVHKFPADPSWLKFYLYLFSDNHKIMSSAVIWFCWIMAKNIKFPTNAIWINIFFLPATKMIWLITIWCKTYEELKNTPGIITVNRTKQSRTWALVTWSMVLNPSQETLSLPWWLSGKEPACQCRRPRFNPWVGKFPWRRKWQPTPVFLPGKFHAQRSLMHSSLWGLKEADTTEWVSIYTHCLSNTDGYAETRGDTVKKFMQIHSHSSENHSEHHPHPHIVDQKLHLQTWSLPCKVKTNEDPKNCYL